MQSTSQPFSFIYTGRPSTASVLSRGMNGSAWKGLIHLVSMRKENSLSSQMIILISISIAKDQWKLKLPWKILILIGMKVTFIYLYIKKKPYSFALEEYSNALADTLVKILIFNKCRPVEFRNMSRKEVENAKEEKVYLAINIWWSIQHFTRPQEQVHNKPYSSCT